MHTKKIVIRYIFFSFCLIFLLSFDNYAMFVENRQTSDANSDQSPLYAQGEILVKFKEGVNPARVLEAANLNIKEISRIHSIAPAVAKFRKTYKLKKDSEGWYSFLGKQYKEIDEIPDEEMFKEAYKNMPEAEKSLYRSYKVKLPEGVNVEEAVNKLKNNPDVEYAQPNYINKPYMVPDDLYYNTQPDQDGKYSWGQAYPDLWGLKPNKLNCQAAWNISQGEGIVVAIIDTGVDYNHEDISANIYRDTTGNIIGYDFSDNDNAPMDYYGHGTHVAGTIAAVGNNSKGIIGVAPKAKIMPVKIFPNAYDSVATQAIIYAADHGAHILNNSWGPTGRMPSNPVIEEAIDYAHEKNEDEVPNNGVDDDGDGFIDNVRGCVIVFAAGNDNDDVAYYSPANYSKTIAVAASTQNDEKASFSNYGFGITVAAPGGGYENESGGGRNDIYNIISTMPDNSEIATERPNLKVADGYWRLAGTSMACPHAAGVAALVLSRNPRLSNEEVREIFKDSSDDIGEEGRDSYFGYGRLNADRAVHLAGQPIVICHIYSPRMGQIVDQPAVRIEGSASSTNFSYYTVEIGEGESPASWITTGITMSNEGRQKVIAGPLAAWDTYSFSYGTYSIKLTVFDASGTSKETIARVKVPLPLQEGWPQNLPPDSEGRPDNLGFYQYPTMADIDKDGKLEIIAGTRNGLIYVWRPDGTLVNGWPVDIGYNAYIPAAGDLDGDGNMEIMAGCVFGKLYVLNHDGSPYTGSWPKGGDQQIGDIKDAVIADIDKDGDLEILASTSWHNVFAWHHNGDIVNGWPQRRIYDATALAVGDIDADGELEIITACWEGKIYAWNADGTIAGGNWPILMTGQRISQSPVIGDVDGDQQLDIVVKTNSDLFVFEGNGNIKAGWPKRLEKDGKILESDALVLGDLDEDRAPEIVITVCDNYYNLSYVWAFKGNGSLFRQWSCKPGIRGGGQISIANVDGDEEQEILLSPNSNNSLYICENDGTVIQLGDYLKNPWLNEFMMPTVNDIDGDGQVEIFLSGGVETTTGSVLPVYVYELPGRCENRRLDWPMFGHDPQHTGCYNYKWMDPTAPTTPVVTDEGEFTMNATQLSCSWVAQDDESGIAEYQYKITQDSSSGALIKDWTSADTGTSWIAFDLNLMSGKTYYFGVKARNGAGLWSETGYSDGITVDAIAPSTTVSGIPAGWSSQPVVVTLSAADDISGVKESLYSIDGAVPSIKYTNPFTLINDGIYSIVYFSMDNAGNQETVQTAPNQVKIDATAPSTPLVTDSGAYSASTDALSASWTSADTLSDIVEYQYTIIQDSPSGAVIQDWVSAGTSNALTATGLYLKRGKIYYFGVKARNGAGLWSETGYSDGITVTPPPYITGITPMRGSEGDLLYIYGLNFGNRNNSSKVKFLNTTGTNTEAEIFKWYDSCISCKVPQIPAGVYKVSVINDAGQSNARSFIVIPPPLPYITFMYPARGRAGTLVYIHGRDFKARDTSSRVEFSGQGRVDNAHIMQWRNSSVICRVPRLPLGPYKVKVINKLGGSNTRDFLVK